MVLFYSIAAVCFALAGFAVFARPNRVEMVSSGIYQRKVIGQNARLEVAFAIRLHTDACARKVCRADIGHLAIENHHLEMDSRAEFALQLFYESRILIEILTEVRSRLLGVQQPHLHTTPDE